MTKADISKYQQGEAEAWTKGLNGKVVAIEPVKKEITVSVKGLMGERTVVLNDTSAVSFRRYAPNSVKYSDAVSGSFADVKTGDQIRARGARNEDGTRFTAEEIISGSFRTAGGKITAIDTVKNEITIDDVVTKKPVTISLSDTTILKKFPLEMAQRYVMMQSMGANGGMRPPGAQGGSGAQNSQVGGQPQAGGTPPPVGNQPGTRGQQPGQPGQGGGRQGGWQGGQGGGGMRMGGGARGGDLDSMLEQLPAIVLIDLKVGDAIAVSSTAGQAANRVSAIKLLAGVEPFLNAPALALPAGAGRQQSPSINIPGLDSMGGF
jgi:ribosomal protein L24